MEFDVSKVTDKKFYDEVLYVTFRESFNFKKPTRKVRILTDILIKYIAIVGIILILSFIAYFCCGTYVDVDTVSFLFSLFIFGIICFIVVKKLIKKFINNNDKSILIVDDVGIELVQENNQNIKTNWTLVKYIIISKYSICIIPRYTISAVVIAFDICYKSKFLKAIKKYDKFDLIVDNSSLYKK